MKVGGGDWQEARRVRELARDAGLTPLRAEVAADIASRKDNWEFAKRIARRQRCSLRTVGRALADLRRLGIIECHRAKIGQVPPGINFYPICGYSHRFVVGRGLSDEQRQRAIARARLRLLARQATRARVAARLRDEIKSSLAGADLEHRKQQARRALAEWESQQQSRDGPADHN